jgi:hypothetical protein
MSNIWWQISISVRSLNKPRMKCFWDWNTYYLIPPKPIRLLILDDSSYWHLAYVFFSVATKLHHSSDSPCCSRTVRLSPKTDSSIMILIIVQVIRTSLLLWNPDYLYRIHKTPPPRNPVNLSRARLICTPSNYIFLKTFLILCSHLRQFFKVIHSLLGFRPQIYITLFSSVSVGSYARLFIDFLPCQTILMRVLCACVPACPYACRQERMAALHPMGSMLADMWHREVN